MGWRWGKWDTTLPLRFDPGPTRPPSSDTVTPLEIVFVCLLSAAVGAYFAWSITFAIMSQREKPVECEIIDDDTEDADWWKRGEPAPWDR